MAKKAFRAESGLDAGGNNVINVTNPRSGELLDGVNVSYFIEKNTVQHFDPNRTYEEGFAVVHERSIWFAKQAINKGPFNADLWTPLRTDPKWEIINGTPATADGRRLFAGEYISAYSVNQELIFTLPDDPEEGDIVVVKDEGRRVATKSIRIKTSSKPLDTGKVEELFTIPGSMKTFVYSRMNGGRWTIHTSVDKIESKLVRSTSSPIQLSTGDMIFRQSSAGHITLQLPKYAVDGDTISTFDLDELTPVNGATFQVHPETTDSIESVGKTSVSTNRTGHTNFVYDEGNKLWRIWGGDIRSRWKPIQNDFVARPLEYISIMGAPSSNVVTVTLPKDAEDGDFVRLSNRYALDGVVVKVKVSDGTTHKILGNLSQFVYPKYKDLAKRIADVPLVDNVEFTGMNYGAVIEFYYNSAAGMWIAAELDLRMEHVDETNRDRPGVAPLASQAEVNKNHEDSPRDDMIITPKTLANKTSTETRRGVSRIATAAEVQVVTSGSHLNDVIITPKRLNERQSTETIRGVAEVATQTEANTNSNDTHIITPKKLDGRRATQGMAGTVKIISDAAVPAKSRTAPGGGVYDWSDATHDEPFVVTPKALNQAQATENSRGVAYVATQSEANTQGATTSDATIITPKKLDARRSTEALAGIAEIATQSETDAGVLDTHIVSPKKLNDRRATEGLHGLAEIATQDEVDAGTDDTRIVSPLKLKTWSSYDHFTTETATGIEHGGNLWNKVNLKIRPASESQVGTLRVATQTEANKQGIDALDTLMITVKKLDARKATETLSGIAEIASQAEVDAELVHTHIITPKSLSTYVHSADSATMNESKNGTAHAASLAETWVGNPTAGSSQAVDAYSHFPLAVTPRGLNYALQNYLPKKGKAFDSDLLDGLDSLQFVRSDQSGRIDGNLEVLGTISTNQNGYGAKVSVDDGVLSYQGGKVDGTDTDQKMVISGYTGKGLTSFDIKTKSHGIATINGSKIYTEGNKPTPTELNVYSKTESDTKFVDAAGDSMTGKLSINVDGEHIELVGTKNWNVGVKTGDFNIGQVGKKSHMIMGDSITTFSTEVKSDVGINVAGTTVIGSDAKINWDKLKSIPSASVTQKGVVQLNNTLDSPSQTEAATANAVKILKEMIDEKAGIEGAIMNDLKIRNWIRIGNVILRPNAANKTLDFVWTDDPL